MEKELSPLKKTAGSVIYGSIYGALSPMPGVSAGTLGVFFNVFDKFFLSATVANARKNLLFIIIFFASWGLGLFWVSQIMDFLLDTYEQLVYFSFLGLILGCVPMIYKKAASSKINVRNCVIFVLSLALMLFLAHNSEGEQYDSTSPVLLLWLFFAGAVSGAAMLIPGVGGSLMMLVLGVYEIYIEAVSALTPLLLAVLGSSMILGILAGIKIIKKLLETHSASLYSSILGFILGSVYFIYPGFYPLFAKGLLSVALAIIFGFLAFRLSSRG